MADEGPWATALRAKRVQWERDLPLNDIITIIDAEGILGQYSYEDIKAASNMIEKRRALVDYFLTKDERCIEKLDEIVQSQSGFEHLKLDVPSTPVLTLQREQVEETDCGDSCASHLFCNIYTLVELYTYFNAPSPS